MFDRSPTAIAGVYLLAAPGGPDLRGCFYKILHQPEFYEFDIRSEFREIYYSTSKVDVIRGMHFQLPPHEHAKLVWCIQGAATDVVLDLRRGSPTYGRTASFELNGETPSGVYIPVGLAHGFVARSEQTTLIYMVTSVYAPENDAGIRWDTIGFDWGVENPLVSERDAKLPPLSEFASPFE
jgi:dTDP-4-dehydrorhamnose 3,5-epimerase